MTTDLHPQDARPHHVQPHQLISDKFELLRELSSGGMGSIWVAHNRVLNNQVAIKLLHESLTCAELRDRLVQEAQLAARIEHSNIVRVLDLDFTERKAPYIVMELLDGRDLADELAECGRLSPTRAVELLLPVLEGLAYAHDRHIVHRDLKPENIFLDRAEGGEFIVPKIVDFGIARCLTESSRITDAGRVFGTVHYLAPEQALGQDDVDALADIWGFCAVLYECVVGHAPFGDRETGLALKSIIVEDVPSPSELGVDVEGLEPILMRGLDRERSRRWPDARSLGQALSRWLIEHGVHEDASAHSVRARWFGSMHDCDSTAPSLTLGGKATVPRARALRRSSPGWVALGIAALFMVSSLASGSPGPSVPELRRLGAPRIAHVHSRAKERPVAVHTPSGLGQSTVPAARVARARSAKPVARVPKQRPYDPVLGF